MVTDNCNTVMTMPVSPTYGVGGSGGFGNSFGNDGWWIILFFILCLGGGWGNNGWGRYGSGGDGGGAAQNYVLASDFATIQRQLSDGFGGVEKGIDTVRNGLCDGFYNNAQLTNGVQMQMANSFAGLTQGMTTQGYETRNAIGQVGTQLAQCCCDTQAAINTGFASTNYNLAQQGCDTRNTLQSATRDVIDAQRDGTNAILNALTAQRIEQKDERIAELTSQLNAARLSASQSAQNETLINTLRPCPIPAYPTCNPWAGNYNNCGCGC